MNKQDFEILLNHNNSITDIANIYGISKSTVKYWLKKFDLVSHSKRGPKSISKIIINANGTFKKCCSCYELKEISSFRIRKDRDTYASYCKECESKNAILRQKALKKKCINYLGNKCQLCGEQYDEKVYQFHHIEPEHKDFNIADHRSHSFENIKDEIDKCILVCANCHYRIHKSMKQKTGYFNKIKNNTELANLNKERKLQFIGKTECESCGYNKLAGNLVISFPTDLNNDVQQNYQKYNKTHWDYEFKEALKRSHVYCRNCYWANNKNSGDNTSEINYLDEDTVYTKNKSTPKCKMCDNHVTEHRNIYCSNECRANDNRKTELPSAKDLIDLLKSLNYTQVGKMYGVSDNAVRKWVKNFGYNPKTLQLMAA